jgi:hypothetical protein
MTTYVHDLAISAVPTDSILVAELSQQLALRMRIAPFWAGNGQRDEAASSAFLNESSRLALVLHQRLWRHDEMTESDDGVLRARLRSRPGSVCVVTLDDEPVPQWLAAAPRCDLAEVGVDGAADFALDAVAASGGAAQQRVKADAAPVEPVRAWREGPAPFLGQPRAVSALRRELDSLGEELEARSRREAASGVERSFALYSVPNRLVARFGEAGVSFSWVQGRMGTVADGRLLVIQWEGLSETDRGPNVLKSATAVREQVYRAEGNDPADWRWRADAPHGRAWSSANLAAEWAAGATLAAVA